MLVNLSTKQNRRFLVGVLVVQSFLTPVMQSAAQPIDTGGKVIGSISDSARRTYEFAISPQRLPAALHTFSAVTGIQVFYLSRLAEGRQSQGVHGTFTAEQALTALLAGTGLTTATTSHGVVTLVLQFDGVKYADTPPISAPAVQLRPIHAEAKPATGSYIYAAMVRYALQHALQQDKQLQNYSYRIKMLVWISEAGKVQDCGFLLPTGNTILDNAVTQTVKRVTIDHPPPNDLLQPVHIDILARGPRLAGRSAQLE